MHRLSISKALIRSIKNRIRAWIGSLKVIGYRFSMIFRILLFGNNAWALLYPEDIKCISYYATKAKLLAVEIGTFQGGSALVIATALPGNVKLVSIDPYIKDSMNEELQGSFWIAFFNLLRHGVLGKVNLLKGYSYEIVKKWNREIDFLFIDGSHEYEHVKDDFEKWAKFVPRGGYVLFHDSNKQNLSDKDKFDNGWNGPTLLCRQIKTSFSHQYLHVDSAGSVNVFQKV